MISIKKGDTRPLDTILERGGVAIDLTSATVVEFEMRSESGAVTVQGPCTITNAVGGGVRYTWATGDTDTAGIYYAEWRITYSDPAASVETVPSDGFETVRIVETIFRDVVTDDGYPSLPAILAESNDESLLSLSAATQLELRAAAIAAIERYCGQSFVPEGSVGSPVARVIDAQGGDEVWLPRRLVSLSTFSALNSWLTLGDIALDPDGTRLYIAPLAVAGAGSWLTRAEATMLGGSVREFPVGVGLLTISGVWGWEATDFNPGGKLTGVTRAIRFEMEEAAAAEASEIAASVRASRRLGLKSISQGGLSAALAAEPAGLSGRVRRELSPFVWRNVASARA